ncbi:MAG TPA: 50S ribosomal protein L9, partial [Aggregatilineales bacterium]|nr:50S ribosomal protein L9 [Aggregatilineales bacterium]
GFARNYLIPKKMAIPATRANQAKMEDLRAQASQNRAVYTERVNTAARQIDGVELVFGVKAGNNNKLYGSITSQMIRDALQAKTGVDINRRRISDRLIRELGRYDVPVRMGEVSPVLKIVVMREDEATAYLRASEPAPQPEEAPVPAAEAAEAAAENPGPAETPEASE